MKNTVNDKDNTEIYNLNKNIIDYNYNVLIKTNWKSKALRELDSLPSNIKDIIFSNVCFKYESSESYVLNNIDLTIESGKFIALVGMSGCGKSTLVNLIPRLYNTSSGSIKINNTNINDLKIDSLRNNISYVGQDTVLFNDSIKNNVTYGKKNIHDDKIYEALEKSYSLNFISEMPDGIDTVIGENGVLLSGGLDSSLVASITCRYSCMTCKHVCTNPCVNCKA